MGVGAWPWQPPLEGGVRVDQRVEDTVVATSGSERAPEHRFELIIRREFDRDLPVAKLVVRAPSGKSLELTDARQLEIFLALGQQALPRLRAAEQSIESEWKEWRDSLGSASSGSGSRGTE